MRRWGDQEWTDDCEVFTIILSSASFSISQDVSLRSQINVLANRGGQLTLEPFTMILCYPLMY